MQQEISRHFVSVYLAARGTEWKTANNIASEAKVAARTARKHLLALTTEGLLEHQTLFEGYHFRGVEKPSAAARQLCKEIESAADAFSMKV